ncbi:hypothetical protein I547_0336 [Mycobacterium kansasii 824]|uniref:Uncharacterized protein n=1 Tax=Mycobacterium kansasii TaxID=1768 RepID=A0A1V3XU47_MYCKA|nr:hypothetical protein I547_0336 [Mycobacterium kansasii 824]KEP42996.1 hypothetical protein MKSMC1_18640 [Mycobacterium kansasii]OOK82744.1 hypothetical protein BZL30_0737 [Mycobacterium kansasii]OOK83955.1 hypothetical protein BZL29_1124 [Mycobacterium kansasii]
MHCGGRAWLRNVRVLSRYSATPTSPRRQAENCRGKADLGD